MIENESNSFFTLLDTFYFMIDFEDLVHIFNTIYSLPSNKYLEYK